MVNIIFELIWYFFIYSFIGWCAEIAYAAVKHKKFMNRGFLNGPLCPVYGIGMVLILVFFSSLKGNFFFLALGCSVMAAVVEFFTGALMEKVFRCKWWDYTGYKHNLGGYICPQFSALWGIGAALIITFVHPFLAPLISMIPTFIVRLLGIILLVITTGDFLSVAGAILQLRKTARIEEIAAGMQEVSDRLGNASFRGIQKRMTRAFPNLEKDGENALAARFRKKERKESLVFAEGCSFHKLVWLFFIGAFLGDITETIFCRLTSGVWMSRSSVLYGPFSIVWGIGVVVLTMMLHKYRDRDDRYIFIFGTVVGGAYEYVCSVFTEMVFGTVFWDYSKIPFNLGGRINLLYCFFWGLASVLWIKNVYPFLSRWIEKVPEKVGKILSWVFLVFMTVNIVLSGMALARYSDRYGGKPAENSVDSFLDTHYPDERMERVYPNAIIKE
uniref:putative ABC transporter permease n=1 Tax=Eisenbergiella tayi TaxID=1432052 RepID=UPI003FEDF68F